MEQTQNNIQDASKQAWCRVATSTAAVAGIIALAACGVLAWHYPVVHNYSHLDSAVLAKMKASLPQMAESPAKDSVREATRALDLSLRQEYFRAQTMVEIGQYVLLGAVIVLIVGLAVAASCRKQLPMPGKDHTPASTRTSALARWSVTAIGIALLAGAGYLLILSAKNMAKESAPASVGGRAASQRGATSREAAQNTAASVPASAYTSDEDYRKNWPGFRGFGGLANSAYTNVPTSWDGPSGKNILWKSNETLLPGENSAVVWGKKVFITGAGKKAREVYCFDADSGKLLWRKPVNTPQSGRPVEKVLEDTGYAAPTAVTNGKCVVALFGNQDMACFDMEGKELWSQNLGPCPSAYGYGTSLCIWRNLVIVMLDQGTAAELGDSKMAAFDITTGKKAWSTARPDVPASWSTPIVINTGKDQQLITCANPWIIAYNPADGKEVWRAELLGGDMAPSPIYAGGFVMAVMQGYKLFAIRPDGKGNVTKTHVAWGAEENLPELVSPVSDGNYVWLCEETGKVTCYDVKTGRKFYEQEIENKAFKSSPSVAGDKLYAICDDGTTLIIKIGPKYEEVGRCPLGEKCNSSPAFQDGRIYLRGHKNLFCIAKK